MRDVGFESRDPSLHGLLRCWRTYGQFYAPHSSGCPALPVLIEALAAARPQRGFHLVSRRNADRPKRDEVCVRYLSPRTVKSLTGLPDFGNRLVSRAGEGVQHTPPHSSN